MAKTQTPVKVEPEHVPPTPTYDYGDDAGAGYEGAGREETSIPFITLLQTNSPQIEQKTVEGAEAGMLYNTVTREMSDELSLIPCHRERCYVEWVPRNRGGGRVAQHEVGSPVVKKAIADNGGKAIGKLKVGENELVETRYLYCLILDPDDAASILGFCVISFTSTKIKVYNDFLTATRLLKGQPPLFANRFRLTSVSQRNEHGPFKNFAISPLCDTWANSLIDPSRDATLLDEAKRFGEMVKSGALKADFDNEQSVGESGGAEESDPPF